MHLEGWRLVYIRFHFPINLKQPYARLRRMLMSLARIECTMNPSIALPAHTPTDGPASEAAIAQLVGQVYATAPPSVRSRLLEHLIKPLGVLSLAVVANGIFASIRYRSNWPEPKVRLEDLQAVQPRDVIALASYVQQVSVHAVDGLAHLLSGSPVMTGSAAASLLVTLLVQRARHRRADDGEV